MTIKDKDKIIAELKAELKKYKDMAAKGLEEFKDVGGCWGCGLQLQLKQDLEDIKHLKAENDRLKKIKDDFFKQAEISHQAVQDKNKIIRKLEQTLQQIKKYIAKICKEECGYVQKKRCSDCDCRYGVILDLITKAEEE